MSQTWKRKSHSRFELERSVAGALVVARLALATLFLVASIMSGSQHYVFYLTVGVFFLVTGLSLVRARRRFVARMLSTGQIAADMIVITVLTAFEQHGGGLFVFLYLVPIISANLLFRRSGGIIVAGISGAAYAGLLVASYLVLDPGERPYSGVQCASYASMTFAVFIVVGMLVRQLVERMQRHGFELHQLRSLHQTILVNMNSGVITTDAGNRVIYANRAAEVILDRDASGIVGEHIGTFFAYRGADGELTAFDPLPERVAQDGSGRAELIGLTPAGRELQIGYNLSLIPSDDGEQHAGKIMLFTDLTEVKQLEQRVRQADRLRAIGELAAGIAHEIRNPLASIAGSIELLGVSTDLTDREQRLLRIITNESDRLNHIIEEFLAYARERVPQLAPHSLVGIVEEVLTLFRNNAGVVDGIDIEVRSPEEPPYVLADHDQLKQVFFNLLRNATDAMPDGGRIEIEIEPPASAASDVCVRVRDTGCGISPEAIEHIFEPFYSTKRRGTGVGLALTEKIIRAHHGTIGAQSGPERGTTFTLTLPQPEAAAVALETAARGT